MRESTEKPRGKAQLDAAHRGIAKEDEAKLNTVISQTYGVENEEALDIHVNYHAERLLASLEKRARENGMAGRAFEAKAQQLDIASVAYQVATGQLVEAAAVDVLFRGLYSIESQGGDNDRYINFYG
jgi:hypothetical protein